MKQNYHCSSSGEIAGGEYGEIRVSGGAKMTGDVVCDALHVSGGVKAAKDLTCGELRASGSLKVEGTLTAAAAKISGGVKVQGTVKITEQLSLSGGLKTEGDVQLANAGISGGLTCSGKVEIPGLLNAETIELSIGSRCEVENIGCTTLKVKKDFTGFRIGAKPCLKTESIEGDTIELEYTEAEVVRGKNVTIGKKCRIGRVEYSETLDIRDGGEVEEQVKV